MKSACVKVSFTPVLRGYEVFEIASICKGGGYLYCRTIPRHPRANAKGLYPLHRVLMENKLRRFLTSEEIVHHVDGDRSNNEPGNLEVMTRSAHAKHHAIPSHMKYIGRLGALVTNAKATP